jgi:hypothetical protein
MDSTFCRGIKRPAETRETVDLEMLRPKKRINMNSYNQPGPATMPMQAIQVDSDDDMGTSSEPKQCKHCLVDIQISKHPRFPKIPRCDTEWSQSNTPRATHQAMFEDLNWIPKILVIEDEKQAEWKKVAKSSRAEMETEKARQDAERKGKKERELELNRERQRRFRAANPKPAKKPRQTINSVCV